MSFQSFGGGPHPFGSFTNRRESERLQRLADSAPENAPAWAERFLERAAPAAGAVWVWAEAVLPVVLNFYGGLYELYCKLPTDAAAILWGLALCFCGGRFPLSIAAAEAFKLTGGSDMWVHLQAIKESVLAVQRANAADQAADADRDGVADVQRLNSKELVMRKATMVLRAVDPAALSEAAGGLWSGYLGVLAALKLRFARTAALAHAIGDSVRPAAGKLMGPAALSITPREHRQWVGPALNAFCKMLGALVAWRLQQTVCTFQSALAGGLLASRAALAMLQRHDLAPKSLRDSDTMADEVVGWSLAAGGIYYQLVKGGSVPALLATVVFPLGLVESALQWSVTFLGS